MCFVICFCKNMLDLASCVSSWIVYLMTTWIAPPEMHKRWWNTFYKCLDCTKWTPKIVYDTIHSINANCKSWGKLSGQLCISNSFCTTCLFVLCPPWNVQSLPNMNTVSWVFLALQKGPSYFGPWSNELIYCNFQSNHMTCIWPDWHWSEFVQQMNEMFWHLRIWVVSIPKSQNHQFQSFD